MITFYLFCTYNELQLTYCMMQFLWLSLYYAVRIFQFVLCYSIMPIAHFALALSPQIIYEHCEISEVLLID